MNVVVHGGPDGVMPIAWDFSTNANPLGPPPGVAEALHAADRRRYPDPHYGAVRERLAAWHGVAAERVLPTAGSSEAIRRLTLAAVRQGVATVWVPQPGYGDYRAAALALGMQVRAYTDARAVVDAVQASPETALVWLCEPCNPTGQSLPADAWAALLEMARQRAVVFALDRAYEPLRLRGSCPVPVAFEALAWQCVSPNKALGLTGVRAGYLLAPAGVAPDGRASELRRAVESLAPSWVLSAEGVALLEAWPASATQAWLADARATLGRWGEAQRAALAALGWEQQPSVVPFWLARPRLPAADLPMRLAQLRERGIKLRDAASFGLSGWVRVSTQGDAARQALTAAWAEGAAT